MGFCQILEINVQITHSKDNKLSQRVEGRLVDYLQGAELRATRKQLQLVVRMGLEWQPGPWGFKSSPVTDFGQVASIA